MRLPTRKAEREKQFSQQDDTYLTQAAYDKYQKELERLKKERIAAAEEVARLGAMGDLSENAAYQYAKQHLRRMLSRITRLELLLAQAMIISAEPSVDGVVRLGSKVIVCVQDKEQTLTILGSHEVRPGMGTISHVSPVGSALIGCRVGDCVEVTVADRKVMYEVIRVK